MILHCHCEILGRAAYFTETFLKLDAPFAKKFAAQIEYFSRQLNNMGKAFRGI